MKTGKPNYISLSKKSFNKQAEIYDSTYYGSYARGAYEYLLNKMNELNFNNILDVGCGTGKMLSRIIQIKGDKINVYGLDISEEMLKKADSRLGKKVTLIHGNSDNIPLDSDLFNIVICNYSFHHYPDPEKVIDEMRRVLKKEGKLLICDRFYYGPIRSIVNFAILFAKSGDVKMYSKKEMTKLLNKFHFKNVTWEKINKKSYLISGTNSSK